MVGIDDLTTNPYSAPTADTNPYSSPTTDTNGTDGQDFSDYLGYSRFFQRLAALFLDVMILSVAKIPLAVALGVMFGIMEAPRVLIEIAAFGLTISVYLIYNVWMISSSRQATLGKMAMGLKVTDRRGRRIRLGRALGRELGKPISAFFLGCGFLMMNCTARRQTLHDLMAGTLVLIVR